MRQILLFAGLIAILLAASSCDDKNDKNKRLDPDAMISLRMAKNVQNAPQTTESRANEDGHLSALEIVKQVREMYFTNRRNYPSSDEMARGFADAQRDFANERLLMWGTDIIDQQGELTPEFIQAENVVLVRNDLADFRFKGDTIAYISNATLRAAETVIYAAYAQGDYEQVYKLFDQAYTFIPITGAEWRELQRQGLN